MPFLLNNPARIPYWLWLARLWPNEPYLALRSTVIKHLLAQLRSVAPFCLRMFFLWSMLEPCTNSKYLSPHLQFTQFQSYFCSSYLSHFQIPVPSYCFLQILAPTHSGFTASYFENHKVRFWGPLASTFR